MKRRTNKIIAVWLALVVALFCGSLYVFWRDVRQAEAELEARREAQQQLRARRAEQFRQRLADIFACADASPRSEGEIFAQAMQDYWRFVLRDQWRHRVVTKHPELLPEADIWHPWKIAAYPTTEALQARLDLLPGRREFDRAWTPEQGWRFGRIVRDFLGGEVNHPETERMYGPEHADGDAGFGVLHHVGKETRWYGPDCCRILSHAEAMSERERRGAWRRAPRLGDDDLPPGLRKEDLRYLRVQWHEVTVETGENGSQRWTVGPVNEKDTEYFFLAPCGTLLANAMLVDEDDGEAENAGEAPTAQAAALPPVVANSLGMRFVAIPAGRSMAGCNPESAVCVYNEVPYRETVISRPFYIGAHEVTVPQWEVVMANESLPRTSRWPRELQPGRQQWPVCCSWNEAQEFVRRLNEREKPRRYRLPTDAEWEHAARAGATTRYFWGEDADQLDRYAWWAGNASRPHPVGLKEPNPWGLYAVIGNVHEWTQTRSERHEETLYMFRGGEAKSNTHYCRLVNRMAQWPSADSLYCIGFRLVLEAY